MGLPVGIIVVLVGIETSIGILVSEFPCDFLRSIGALKRVGLNDLRAEAQQDLLSGRTCVPWESNSDTIAPGRTDQGVGYTRITAGGIEYDLVGR
jgi:hypothetical protein